MELLFYFVIFAIIADLVFYSVVYGISPTPTSKTVKEELLKMIPSEVRGKVVELGSGWGTLVFALAERLPHCSVRGYEISPLPYVVSVIRKRLSGCANATFLRQNFFKVSLEGTSLIVCYLYPGAMHRLQKKLRGELRSGALVLTHTFAFPGWTPIDSRIAGDIYRTPVYLYRV